MSCCCTTAATHFFFFFCVSCCLLLFRLFMLAPWCMQTPVASYFFVFQLICILIYLPYFRVTSWVPQEYVQACFWYSTYTGSVFPNTYPIIYEYYKCIIASVGLNILLNRFCTLASLLLLEVDCRYFYINPYEKSHDGSYGEEEEGSGEQLE